MNTKSITTFKVVSLKFIDERWCCNFKEVNVSYHSIARKLGLELKIPTINLKTSGVRRLDNGFNSSELKLTKQI